MALLWARRTTSAGCRHPATVRIPAGPGEREPADASAHVPCDGIGALAIVRCALRALRRVTSTADEVAMPSLYRDNYAVTLWVLFRAPLAAILGHAELTRLYSTVLSRTPNILKLESNSSRYG